MRPELPPLPAGPITSRPGQSANEGPGTWIPPQRPVPVREYGSKPRGLPPGRSGELLGPGEPRWLVLWGRAVAALRRMLGHPWHRRETVRDTGMHRYQVCRCCGARSVLRVGYGGHQPVDRHWLANGEFGEWPTHPQQTGGRNGWRCGRICLGMRAGRAE